MMRWLNGALGLAVLGVGFVASPGLAQAPAYRPALAPPALLNAHVLAAEALELVSLQLRVESVMGTDPNWQRAAWDSAVARPDRQAAAAAIERTAERLFAFVGARLAGNRGLSQADRARGVARLADARRLWAYARGANSDREPALSRAFEALAVADPRVPLVSLRGIQGDVLTWVEGQLQQSLVAPTRPGAGAGPIGAVPTAGPGTVAPPSVNQVPLVVRPGDATFVPGPPTAVQAPAGGMVRYLGCFKDQEPRDLSGHSRQDSRMTTQLCVAECGEKGFAYAGTQYGSFCFCGNRYGASGAASNCDMSCAGNPGERCGGSWANSVHQVGGAVTAQPPVVEDPLGVQWSVVENGLDGVWTRRPGSNSFDAFWPRVNVRAVLGITLVGTRVTVVRRQSSDGNDCEYLGQLDGMEVRGTYTCIRARAPMPWQATIRAR